MKKILLGTALALALLTGCTEEKKAPVQAETTTQDVKKDEVIPTQTDATEEMKKEDIAPIQDEVTKEESK